MENSGAVDTRKVSSSEGRQLWRVFAKVFGFIIVIMIVPVVAYFFTKTFVFEAKFGYQPPDSNFWAAGVAIALVHIGLVVFIYVAFSEEPKAEKVE